MKSIPFSTSHSTWWRKFYLLLRKWQWNEFSSSLWMNILILEFIMLGVLNVMHFKRLFSAASNKEVPLHRGTRVRTTKSSFSDKIEKMLKLLCKIIFSSINVCKTASFQSIKKYFVRWILHAKHFFCELRKKNSTCTLEDKYQFLYGDYDTTQTFQHFICKWLKDSCGFQFIFNMQLTNLLKSFNFEWRNMWKFSIKFYSKFFPKMQ